MWPKLLMQLVEFLPHATRLMPLADRYLNSNASSTEALASTERAILDLTERGMQANANALNGVSEQVQTSLGKVARAHIEMAAKLDEFAGQVTDITTEAKRARRASEFAQTRVDALEKQLANLRQLMLAGLATVAVLLLIVIVLLFRVHTNTAF